MTRALLRSLVLLVVLAVVVVAADRITSSVVSGKVAEGLQAEQRLSARPGVTFVDSPFLTQALRGRYSRVDVTMTGVPTDGPLVVDRLDATLLGVRADAREAMRGTLTTLPVERGEAVGFVSFASLQDAAKETLRGRSVELSLGPGASASRMSFKVTLSTALGRFTVRGQAQLTVSRGGVEVRILPETLGGIPAVLRSQVAAQVDLSGLVPPLPYGFEATGVAVEGDGLRLHAAGSQLNIPV